MSSTESNNNNALEYRSIPLGAILALVLGFLAVVVPVAGTNTLTSSLLVSPIPLIGMFLGLRAWIRIRQAPEMYTGQGLAVTGFFLSTLFFIGGLGYSVYVYQTELPNGYVRSSFPELQPDDLDERAQRVIPKSIKHLGGKRVFIKGYIRQDSTPVRTNIDRFILVRDNQECCFGSINDVAYFDQILVTMQGSMTTDYSTKLFRIGGVLKFHPENLAKPGNPPVYTMKVDYVQ